MITLFEWQKCLELESGDGYMNFWLYKTTTELYTLKGLNLWYGNYISMGKKGGRILIDVASGWTLKTC